jgi:hypothetical protein
MLLKLDRSSRIYSLFRRIKRRTKSASAVQIILEVLAAVAMVVQLTVPVIWAVQKVSDARKISENRLVLIEAGAFLACVIYGLIHRYFLVKRFKPRHFAEEEKRQPLRLSQAVAKFTIAAAKGAITSESLLQIERSLLEIIKSEVEAMLADIGPYLSVNLLTFDREDNSRLRCVNRTDTTRQIPCTYHKDGMLAWDSMRKDEVVYEPDFKKDEKPYRCVLCMPLAYQEDSTKTALGVVTLDHSIEHEFDGLIDRMKITLSPYLRLLELALVYRLRLETAPVIDPAPKVIKAPARRPH